MSDTCAALTYQGDRRCRNRPEPGSTRCAFHPGAEPPSKHFQPMELEREWARSAMCAGLHGLHSYGKETDTMLRFLTHQGVGE